jgi:hypothetical protein
MARQRLLEPGHPARVAMFEEGQHQVVLARVVAVEAELGHARFGDHAVDAGGADALAVEQVVGGERMRSRAPGVAAGSFVAFMPRL